MIDTETLKRKILQLAVQGKLVRQNSSDIPAKETVTEISQKLNRCDFQEIEKSEIPFPVPCNWCWCRLSDIATTNIGLTYHPEDIDDGGTIVIRSSNIVNNHMDYTDLVKVKCLIKDNQYLNDHDIVICARNGSKALVGKCAIFEEGSEKVAFGAFMAVLRTEFYKYVYYYLQTNAFRRYFSNDDTKQINQVTQKILKNALIPIPPVEEQDRITNLIESIFDQIHTIDLLQQRYTSDVSALKSKVIDAGIQGKLTEQLPEDGTAQELFERIQKEKTRLVKEGEIKKQKPLPPITPEEIPFEIPENWMWVRLGEIGNWSAGATPSRSNPDYYNGNIPWIKTGELNDDYINDSDEYISDAALHECSVRLNPVGSVLIAMYGATIGKTGILDIEATTNQACCACIPFLIDNKYLFYFLIGNKQRFLDKSHGGAQPNISKDIIVNSPFPLPPLAEQKRIAERIEEILSVFSEA